SPEKIIVTTEKDAIRISSCFKKEIISKLPVFYIPIEVGFLTKNEEENFYKIITGYVRKNKPVSSIHF
ncbi:MAG: tetraacyldisaccharide 4'-kinase, partial [Bacteroidetes bacterium HGW-Bacteroidetes-21]